MALAMGFIVCASVVCGDDHEVPFRENKTDWLSHQKLGRIAVIHWTISIVTPLRTRYENRNERVSKRDYSKWG